MPYDGQDLRRMVEAGLDAIAAHKDEVNALNVFPVPDGDSGTNLTLTLQSAAKAIEGSDERHAGQLAMKAARGALLGARGNSGVIFSQILRGLAKGLEGEATFEAPEFARALRSACEHAYKSVMEPVEGTILTVLRATTEHAERAAAEGRDLLALLEGAVAAAGEAVEKTTEQLDVLKQAGVVDSAGKGFHYILDGMHRCLVESRLAAVAAAAVAQAGHAEALDGAASGGAGAQSTAGAGAQSTAGAGAAGAGGAAAGADGDGEGAAEGAREREFGVEVQFMIEGQGLDVATIRAEVARMGESVLVVGDESMVKVHVHTLDPDRVVEYAKTLGEPQQLTFEDLDAQAEAFREQKGGR